MVHKVSFQVQSSIRKNFVLRLIRDVIRVFRQVQVLDIDFIDWTGKSGDVIILDGDPALSTSNVLYAKSYFGKKERLLFAGYWCRALGMKWGAKEDINLGFLGSKLVDPGFLKWSETNLSEISAYFSALESNG